MDQPQETLWHIGEWIVLAVLGAVASAVGYVWRQHIQSIDRITTVEGKTTMLADAVENICERQDNLEHEQNNQRVLLAEIRNDVRWIREELSQRHK